MDRLERPLSNTANAIVELDCPWCAEPVRATDTQLADGLACPACLVVVRLDAEPTPALVPFRVPVAA
jgi:hypothetical protein